MDITDLIKSQIEEAISIDSQIVGLESVQTHIERAEYLLNLGKKNSDDHLYTDVIYRTNHAFEGIMKEAHTVLTGKDSSKKTPQQIEKYLLDNNILNPRVVDLLKNYRQEWRNTSTHDYNLFFNHSEAFLAIVSVSAFVHVLLNQIIDRLIYNQEKEKLKETSKIIKLKLGKTYQSLTFIEKVAALFAAYEPNVEHTKEELEKNSKSIHSRFFRYARETISSLSAHFNSTDKTIKTETEPLLEVNGMRARPDFIFTSKAGEKVIAEVKILRNRTRRTSLFRRDFESQLVTYMTYTNINLGILYIMIEPFSETLETSRSEKIISVGGTEFKIIIIEQLPPPNEEMESE